MYTHLCKDKLYEVLFILFITHKDWNVLTESLQLHLMIQLHFILSSVPCAPKSSNFHSTDETNFQAVDEMGNNKSIQRNHELLVYDVVTLTRDKKKMKFTILIRY